MKRLTKIGLSCVSVCAVVGLVMVGITCLKNGFNWIPETFSFMKIFGL